MSRTILLCLMLLLPLPSSAVPHDVVLYTYQSRPPYSLVDEVHTMGSLGGIFHDLAQWLNGSQKEYRFSIRHLPRKRLDLMLEAGRLRGGVVGVNPVWFNDKARTRYLWTAPFMLDQDMLVVAAGKAFPYSKPTDLAGRRMVLPRGYYYRGVTELA